MNIFWGFKHEPYIKINLFSAGIILLMLVYFGIFSAQGLEHPVPSMYNFKVPSTGLSRSISAIMRLDFSLARSYNPYGFHIFLFFFIQLLLRIIISVLVLYNRFNKKLLIIFDIVVSVLLLLATFGVYLVNQMIELYA